MKKPQLKTLLLACVLLGVTSMASAQFKPGENQQILGNAGIGFSGYGIPIYVSVDLGVANHITVGVGASFQTNTENFNLGFDRVRWKHTIFGITARGDYHFNELMGLPDAWDVYAGLGLDYYSWETKLKDGPEAVYRGSGSGGFGVSGRVGGRYFFKENLAVNLELGGGSVLSTGRVGVTLLF